MIVRRRFIFAVSFAVVAACSGGKHERSGAVVAQQQPTPTPTVAQPVEEPQATAAPAPVVEAPPRPADPQRPSEGLLVVTLQEELRSAGHAPGPIDGHMGPRTERAVREFQAEIDLPATGLPDRDTLEALFAPLPVENVAGYEPPVAIESNESPARGWSSWTLAILAGALALAIIVNIAQWSANHRPTSRRAA